MKNLLILYTKIPKIGKTKTRLAKETNPLFAFLVSLCSFKDTINKVSNSKNYDFIAVVDSEEEAKIFKEKLSLNAYVMDSSLLKLNQSERFKTLFSKFLKKYDKVALIPSDVPAITESTIIESFNLLKNNNHVFGPEFNGGVYLIGSSNLNNNIFSNVRWSTENSLKDLIKNVNSNFSLMEINGDINTLNDLKILNKKIKKHSSILNEFLSSNLYQKEAKAVHAYN